MTQQMQPSAVDGLFNHPKTLPTWLLYDDAGSQIYTRITGLPEYYLTRAEAEIFAQQGERIVERALAGAGEVSIVELGAGSSEKTELFLRAVVRAHGNFVHLACDIERGALELGVARLREAFPQCDVRGFVGTHEAAGAAIAELAGRQLVLFIGSSIGNLSDEQATAMLSALRARLRSDGGLLLGTDLKKQPERLLAAYDDAAGVTAQFTLNILTRLNRELDADFNLEHFRHVACWNAQASDIEIYIESTQAQTVAIGRVNRTVSFTAGERVLVEISAKYDLERVERLLRAAGFERAETFIDSAGDFAVHLARCVPLGEP